MPSWVQGFVEWVGRNPQMLGLLASLFGTQFVKGPLLSRVLNHRAKVADVRSFLRLTAFGIGAFVTYFLWDGDPRYGLVWAVLVGFASPTIYKISVAWRADKGDSWAKRMSAEDKILRRYTPPDDDPAADDETTVMGSRGRP